LLTLIRFLSAQLSSLSKPLSVFLESWKQSCHLLCCLWLPWCC